MVERMKLTLIVCLIGGKEARHHTALQGVKAAGTKILSVNDASISCPRHCIYHRLLPSNT